MSLLVLTAAVPYLVPTVIAAYRDHPAKTAIFGLNLLLGWTVIGWVVALIWACSGSQTVQPVMARGDEAGPSGLKLQGRDPRVDGIGLPEP